MKTYKIKLVVEAYVDVNVDELMKEIKQALPEGVLLVNAKVEENRSLIIKY